MTWRIGLLIPSSNTVMEMDFHRGIQPDTSVHTGRMYMVDTTPEGETRMLEEFTMPAAEALATTSPHLVVFGCTSAGALYGKERDQELCERIGAATNAIPVSVIASVTESLRDTRASSVAIITPYVDELNERIKSSVEAEGFEVTAMHGMGLSHNFDIAQVTPHEIVNFVREHLGARVPADALFISCTNLNAINTLSELRLSYEVPIVTSNQAALQAVNRVLNELRQRGLEQQELTAATQA